MMFIRLSKKNKTIMFCMCKNKIHIESFSVQQTRIYAEAKKKISIKCCSRMKKYLSLNLYLYTISKILINRAFLIHNLIKIEEKISI